MEEKEIKKPTVEELEKEINGYKGMINQLLNQLQSANMSNVFKRLDYLFKVLENSDKFSIEFVSSCSDEIVGIMTPPKEESEVAEVEEIN